MKRIDVICIGAALVDMIAEVERFPLDDDEVFVSDLQMLSGGAAANTAAACSILGLNTAFIGKLGQDDEFGRKIIKDFKKVSVKTEYIKYSDQYTTGSAYVALNKQNKNRRIFAHSGAANYLSKTDIKEEELITSKLIYLSSLKNLDPFIEAGKIGQKNGIPVVLNPGMLIIEQKFDKIKELLQYIDILILSRREYATLLSLNNEVSEQFFIDKSEQLKKLGIKIIIITLGKKGALLIYENHSLISPPIKIDRVADTTGAGDAFSAGFMYGYSLMKNLTFKNLIKCVKIGNFVAGNCIQKLGARYGIPSQEEVKEFQKKF
jgi:ribokinase